MKRYRKTARFFGRIAASRVGLGGPIHLSHLITGRCDCRCPTCLWRDNQSEEMCTEEVESLYRAAGRTGFVANAIWGGEPLMRADLARLCRASRQAGMITTVITNGYYLAERARELAGVVDSLIVSIDYPDRERHDAFRGREGVFAGAVEGIQTLQSMRSAPKIIINCLLHRGNESVMTDMAELATSLGASLYVCPAKEGTVRETGESNRAAVQRRESEQRVAEELLQLKRKHSINNSRAYLRRFLLRGQPYQCRAPLVFLTVNPNGDVVNCFRGDNPYGNVRRVNMDQILRRWSRRECFEAAEGCISCNNPNVVDTSYIWHLSREPLLNAVRMFLST